VLVLGPQHPQVRASLLGIARAAASEGDELSALLADPSAQDRVIEAVAALLVMTPTTEAP